MADDTTPRSRATARTDSAAAPSVARWRRPILVMSSRVRARAFSRGVWGSDMAPSCQSCERVPQKRALLLTSCPRSVTLDPRAVLSLPLRKASDVHLSRKPGPRRHRRRTRWFHDRPPAGRPGHAVRLLTRSGSGPEHPLIERRKVDVSQAGALAEHFDGAAAVYHCIHGSAYSAKAWRAELPAAEQAVLAAAGAAGAVVVFPESLYSYGPVDVPMTEDLPRDGDSRQARRSRGPAPGTGGVLDPTVSVAASDFYGPLVRTAHAGERLVPAVLSGKRVSMVGSLDQPHSFTYVPDLARAMIVAAKTPSLWGQVLHAPTAPAITQREMARRSHMRPVSPRRGCPSLPAWVLSWPGWSRWMPASWRRRRTCSRGRSCWTRRTARGCSGWHRHRSRSRPRRPSTGGAPVT